MNIKKTLLSILIGASASTIAVAIYNVLFTLNSEDIYLYSKLIFLSSITIGGLSVFYILYNSEKERISTSVIYGFFTATIIFFLVGFIIVNLYGS